MEKQPKRPRAKLKTPARRHPAAGMEIYAGKDYAAIVWNKQILAYLTPSTPEPLSYIVPHVARALADAAKLPFHEVS